jgi:hypothetical protein
MISLRVWSNGGGVAQPENNSLKGLVALMRLCEKADVAAIMTAVKRITG